MQYACDPGQVRRSPKGKRDEELADAEAAIGEYVTWKDSMQIPHVG